MRLLFFFLNILESLKAITPLDYKLLLSKGHVYIHPLGILSIRLIAAMESSPITRTDV